MKLLLSSLALMVCVTAAAADKCPVRVRVHNFVVSPSTGPVAQITVANTAKAAYEGTVKPTFPKGWKVTPAQYPIKLAAGESKKLSFAIETGIDVEANTYPVAIQVEGGGKTYEFKQQVVCASAPYYKPKINGKLDDWKDAIPITFSMDGKKTIVRLYWNRQFFCIAVEVEETKLISLKKASKEKGVDAIQFALAPAVPKTSTSFDAKSVRYEFLLIDSGSMWSGDRCYSLMRPGAKLASAEESQSLKSLVVKDASVTISHSRGTTTYEAAIPMKSMKSLRATAGREFTFSLLVHDPDGTGVRDLGSVMNLVTTNPLAWSSWEFAKWNKKKLLDNKVEFGFCSSIH